MGWNSWNTFGPNINEALIRETADVMVDSGLAAAGYNYLVIDGRVSRKIPQRYEGRCRLCPL